MQDCITTYTFGSKKKKKKKTLIVTTINERQNRRSFFLTPTPGEVYRPKWERKHLAFFFFFFFFPLTSVFTEDSLHYEKNKIN